MLKRVWGAYQAGKDLFEAYLLYIWLFPAGVGVVIASLAVWAQQAAWVVALACLGAATMVATLRYVLGQSFNDHRLEGKLSVGIRGIAPVGKQSDGRGTKKVSYEVRNLAKFPLFACLTDEATIGNVHSDPDNRPNSIMTLGPESAHAALSTNIDDAKNGEENGTLTVKAVFGTSPDRLNVLGEFSIQFSGVSYFTTKASYKRITSVDGHVLDTNSLKALN